MNPGALALRRFPYDSSCEECGKNIKAHDQSFKAPDTPLHWCAGCFWRMRNIAKGTQEAAHA